MTLGPVGSPTFWSFASSPLLSNSGNALVLATDVAASGVCAATAALLAGSALEVSLLQERYKEGPWTANAATQTSDASFLKSFSSNLKHAQKEGRGCYNVGKPCMSAAVWPWHAPLRTLGKNALLCSLFTMNKWMHTLLNVMDEQDRGEEVEFPPFPDLKPSLIESFWLSVREMWVLTTRRVLEVWMYLNTSAQVRWKMLKDPWASIRRKHSRLGGAALRGSSPVRQAASCWLRSYNRLVWCHVLQHAADFMVSVCFSAWHAWGHAAVMGGRAPKHRAEYFARCVAKDALRIVGSVVMTWSVAATAAMIARLLLDAASPQVSGLSWLAMMGFDLLWGMTVNEWLYPWIAAAM